MFHHYSDILGNKLQLAIGIAGIVSGLCFHLLPRLPKIISIVNHKTNPTLTEVDSAGLYYAITCWCYIIPAMYADKTSDPIFLAFNLTGFLISCVYGLIATFSLPQDKLVRDASRDSITALYYVVMNAAMVSAFWMNLRGVLGTIAFVVVCGVKLGFEMKDVGPVWLLVSSLVMMLNGGIWIAYGVLAKDVFICVSSGIGCGAGVAGLVLLCVKKSRSNNDNKVAPVVDNGDGIV